MSYATEMGFPNAAVVPDVDLDALEAARREAPAKLQRTQADTSRERGCSASGD